MLLQEICCFVNTCVYDTQNSCQYTVRKFNLQLAVLIPSSIPAKQLIPSTQMPIYFFLFCSFDIQYCECLMSYDSKVIKTRSSFWPLLAWK